MEYLRVTGAWMNEINRHIDDVVVKAGVGDRGGWRVSSMDWPCYFQVVGESEKGSVGFVGDGDSVCDINSGTWAVWCKHVGQAHAVPAGGVEEVAECLDMPLERASIAVAGMTAVVERGYAALSNYGDWTLVETNGGRLLPGLMTQRGPVVVDIDRAIGAGRLGLGSAAYIVDRDGGGVWAEQLADGERIEPERINTRWSSYVVLPGAEFVTGEVHDAAWAAWSAQEPALGRVGPRENKDVYEWHPEGDFSISSDGVPVVRYQNGEWTTVVSVEDTELVNLVKGEQIYAMGISVPAARYLIEADLIRQASWPGMSTSTAPEGPGQELVELIGKISSCDGGSNMRVAYVDGVPCAWVEGECVMGECIVRLIEGAEGVVEAATPSGVVRRESLRQALGRAISVEDESVLYEVFRQLGSHPAAVSSSPVEAS
ncbi:hypothetical protein BKH31_02810 [Actinomyces oris]|uniref:Uncharacterized protein n=1 Tax=Actinomyces oris TaxID=544580 RepID=A0A1Q8VJA7_9ACTO|nr:hypothetical protein [Actinomyces oris]OLO48176.1 hypothetical protein BKH31_02810 [Actinomyces oris]